MTITVGTRQKIGLILIAVGIAGFSGMAGLAGASAMLGSWLIWEDLNRRNKARR